MSNKQFIEETAAPVKLAMVCICEKCGRRADESGKNPSHRLASKFKRLAKEELGKKSVRVVLTSCMDICPDDQIAIAVQPAARAASCSFWISEIDDLDASSEALLGVVRALVNAA